MNSPSESSASPASLPEGEGGCEAALRDTRRWLERAVIGLNLCPFAKAVQVRGRIHLAATQAVGFAEILEALGAEVDALLAVSAQERDTTLLVLPAATPEFLEFQQLVAAGERLLRKRKLQGVLQLASFHPAFEFAGAEPQDMGNYSNRSPHPTLHLLREESLDRAVAAFPDAAGIYETNIATLRRLGPEGWRALDLGPHR